MEIRTLRYFLKVCEIENITRAAVVIQHNTAQPFQTALPVGGRAGADASLSVGNEESP